MENVSDAVIMAGEILIFIIALSVCISSFSTLRQNIDNIVGQTETVEMVTDGSTYVNYITSKLDNATRAVGVETVVTSMYRAVKENYTVYVKLNDYSGLTSLSSSGKLVYYEADKTQTILDANGATLTLINAGDKLIKVTIGSSQNKINQNVNEILSGRTL